MPAEGNRLYLYEALELRAEYDARIKTLRDCLPEARKNRDQFGMYGNDQHQLLTADDFDVSATRESTWRAKRSADSTAPCGRPASR